jgi:antitoxin MazE
MKTRIQKWGNSLALRIPRPFAEDSRLREHSPVDLSVRGGNLVVTALPEQEFSLDELVARITPRNRHHETETGGPVGSEVW